MLEDNPDFDNDFRLTEDYQDPKVDPNHIELQTRV